MPFPALDRAILLLRAVVRGRSNAKCAAMAATMADETSRIALAHGWLDGKYLGIALEITANKVVCSR